MKRDGLGIIILEKEGSIFGGVLLVRKMQIFASAIRYVSEKISITYTAIIVC